MKVDVDVDDAAARPLAGTRVVEVSSGWSAAAVAGSLLADLGAECTHVPATDERDRPVPGLAPPVAIWRDRVLRHLLRSKQVADSSDPQAIEELLATADILVVDADGYALLGSARGWEAVGGRHPGLLRAAVTPYGLEGPLAARPATELTVQAASGVLATTGHRDGPPTRVGFPVGQHVAALNIVSAALATRRATSTPARRGRHLGRLGRPWRPPVVETAVFDGLFDYLSTFLDSHVSGGDEARRLGNHHPLLSPWNTYKTADGELVICAPTDVAWRRLYQAIEPSGLGARAPDWDSLTRLRHRAQIDSAIEAWTRVRSTGEAIEVLRAGAVPCAPVQALREALADPLVAHRDTIGEEPSVGRYARPPFRISPL